MPVVILVSGMGLQDRDWTFLKGKYQLARLLSDSLNREGFAVLRYDDRGHGKSTGTKETVTSFDDLAEDVYAAVRMLRKRSDVGKVGLMGHSLGGILSVITAAKHHDIDFIITLAGSFQNGGDIMMEQARTLKRWKTAEHMTDAEVIRNGEMFVRNWVAFSGGRSSSLDTVKNILKDLLRYQIRNMSPEDSLKNMKIYTDTASMLAVVYEDIVGYYTSPHQQSFAIYDPVKDLPKVKCPVLVLFGQKDQHVTVRSNLPKLAEAIAVSGVGNITIFVQPDADHTFSALGGMQTGQLASGLMTKIACWLKALSN